MRLLSMFLVGVMVLGASSKEVKVSANSYPIWFQDAISPLLKMDKENAVTPFLNVLEGKKKKVSSKKKEEGKQKEESKSKETSKEKQATTKKEKEVKNANLFRIEGGRVASIVDNIDLSMELLTPCIERYRREETEAVVSVSKGARKAGSTLLGEGVNLYQEKPYEKVTVYTQQAFNYLCKNNLEDAMVELRNADAEQKRAAEKYKKEIEKVKEDGKNINYDEIIQNSYAGLDELTGKVKTSFQNAYSFYLYGIVSECSGIREGKPSAINDAYIAYKDALEIYPDNVYLQKDVIRLAKTLNMENDYKELIQRFPQHANTFENYQPNPEAGNLIVIFEDGFVPYLQEISIPIPTPDGVLTMSFPTYSPEDKREPLSMQITVDSNSISGDTSVICNLAGMAAKSLKERLPGMIVREILQSAALGVAQHQANKKLGVFGSLMVTAIDTAISKADLRSIYSFPYYIQCFRTEIDPGIHKINLSPSGFGSVDLDLEIKPKSFTIIRITCIGDTTMYHKVIQL